LLHTGCISLLLNTGWGWEVRSAWWRW